MNDAAASANTSVNHPGGLSHPSGRPNHEDSLLANKGGNPNPTGKGKPTQNVGWSQQVKSPVFAQGDTGGGWPTVNRDLPNMINRSKVKNPLQIKHAYGANNARKDNKA